MSIKAEAASEIPVRKPGLEFDASIPKAWLADNPLASHAFNGMNLVFPDGERFFVKAVYDHLDRIDDPLLLARAKQFAGQEGQHANQHEKYFAALRAQGYRIDRFLDRFNWFMRFSNRWFPASLRLSMTAGAEHYTATFGADAIRNFDTILSRTHPTMRQLIVWHATEEIEHKAVAFDVLEATHPSYLLRIIGFIFATIALFGWTGYATRMLLRQDGVTREQVGEYEREIRKLNPDGGPQIVVDAFKAYLKRDFHPNDTDELADARRCLAEVGLPA